MGNRNSFIPPGFYAKCLLAAAGTGLLGAEHQQPGPRWGDQVGHCVIPVSLLLHLCQSWRKAFSARTHPTLTF